MSKINVPCFFMICTNRTEEECLTKGLFGDKEWRLPYLKSIKKEDIGFLLNISRDQLLGIFVAESEAKLNIDPNAWNGEFPAQVKVKLIGQLQRIEEASKKLEKIMRLREIKREPSSYKVPEQNTYGPDITEQVLALFKLEEEIKEYFKKKPTEEIGIFSEYTIDDVAGLEDVKKFINQRIIEPFKDEEAAYKLGLRIGGGILLFGPPGTGKTLIAMAIANSIQAKFIEIIPSVIMGYPGEAERRIENIFASLEKEPRAVIFLDEAEWILCKSDKQSSSVMQRVIPVLLIQLSKIFKQKKKPIIVIAATNKPEMIDDAFLRPGRFDKAYYVGLPDRNARIEIIKIHLQNRAHELSDDEVSEIAEKLEGYSGADIEHIIEEAAYIAYEKYRSGVKDCKIIKEDIIQSINNTPPSVNKKVIKKIEKWAKQRNIKIK